MAPPFVPYLVQNYAAVKERYPAEGRRKWRLRAAQQFWAAVGSGASSDLLLSGRPSPSQDVGSSEMTPVADSDTDPDPLDEGTRDTPELGLIVRTDFSDEASWVAFCTRLQDSEKELISGSDADVSDEMDEDEDESDEDDGPPAIFHIINPSSPHERELLAGVSNLTVLRLFNDVDVRPSPSPSQGTKRVNPPNRLVDYRGWQEFYRGKNVWVYDAKSNVDQCVRVVSQSGDMYGTATGDSWRARVSHICELQVSMSAGTIKIDFGGLDRWDFDERRCNMVEAESGSIV